MIVAVEESDSTVGFYNSDTGEEIARVATGTWPHEIAVSADRKTAYVSNFGIKDYDEHIGQPGASVSVIDLELMAERERLYTFRSGRDYARRVAPHSVVLDKTRSRLLVNVEAEDTLLRFELAGGSPRGGERFLAPAPGALDPLPDAESRLPEGTHAMLLSPDGNRIYLGCGPAGLFEVDAETGQTMRSLNCGGPVRGLAFTADGQELIVSAGGGLCFVDSDSMSVKRRHELTVAQLLYPTPVPDGDHVLVPAVWEGLLLKVNAATGAATSMIVGADPIHLVIPDGDAIAYLGHGRSKYISRIDWAELREVGRIPTRGGPNGLEWAPLRERPPRKRFAVGAAIPLSGLSRSEGNDLRLGYQYWAELVNAAGGIVCGGDVYEAELLLEDTRSVVGRDDEPPLPDGTSTKEHLRRAASKLIERGASALLGTYPSPPHFVVREVAEERGVPLITASGAASEIYSGGFRNVFGIMTAAKGFLNGSFDLLARQQPQPQTAFFLSCRDNAAREDAETTAEHISANLNIDVIGPAGPTVPPKDRVVQFAHNQLQFDELIDTVIAFDPDVLAVTGHLPESIAITRGLAERSWAPKAILFSVGPAFPAFSTALGPLAEHLMGSAMWSATQVSHGHDRFITPRTFRDAFYARFSKEPSYLAAGALACGIVIEEAIRKGGSVVPQDIAAALRAQFSMRSFYSPIALDEKGLNSGRGLLTIQLRRSGRHMEHASLWPPSLAGPAPDDAVWPFPGWPTAAKTSDPH